MNTFARAASSDPAASARMRAGVADSARTTDSTRRTLSANDRRARRTWVSLAADRSLRRGLVAAIHRDLHRRSGFIERAIDATPNAAWDVVVVGAGSHAAAIAHELATSPGAPRTLTLEQGGIIGANFGSAGVAFRMNSANFAEQGDAPRANWGNLNPVRGPVEMADLSGDAWPTAEVAGDTTAIALHAANSDVLMQSRVERVERAPEGSGARYRVTFANRAGLRRSVLTNAVVVATGLGRPRITFGDEATKKLAAEGLADAERMLAPQEGDVDGPMPIAAERSTWPRIMTVGQALALANRSPNGRDVYRQLHAGAPAPRIAVVGGGDSASTMVEYLYGLAPGAVYDGPGRSDQAQRGDVGRVEWAVGLNPEADLRPRYASTFALQNEQRLDILRARLSSIRPIGRGTNRRFQLVYDLGEGRTQISEVDYVLLATGFTNVAGEIVESLAGRVDGPIQQSAAVRPVEVGGRKVAQRVGNEDVFLAGNATGLELVTQEELGTTPVGRAALLPQLPRTIAFARDVLARVAHVPAAQSVDVQSTIDRAEDAAAIHLRPQPGAVHNARLGFDPRRHRIPLGYDAQYDLAVRYEVADAFRNLRLPAGVALDVDVVAVGHQELMLVTHDLDAPSAAAVRMAIASQPRLMALLQQAAAVGRSTFIDVPARASGSLAGQIRVSTLDIGVRRNPRTSQ